MLSARATLATAVGLLLVSIGPWPAGGPVFAQRIVRQHVAALESADLVRLPSVVDSNSPAFWQSVDGIRQLVVITSTADSIVSAGPWLGSLAVRAPAVFDVPAPGGRWIEAAQSDHRGRLYGYYHNEPPGLCGSDSPLSAPRIGAAVSDDGGLHWVDLGIVLDASSEANCASSNQYFAGGVGDFSAALDPSGQFLYFLFSSYGPALAAQGVSVARLDWAYRDDPMGHVAVWSSGTWRLAVGAGERWEYPEPSPILPAVRSWHGESGPVDAFWGPSVHWNTHLRQYVMLLNHAIDRTWKQEGIYLSSTSTLEDPDSWTRPLRILEGGQWYPQVMGIETGSGTDKVAGQRARFFMSGVSTHDIVFLGPAGTARPR